MAKVIDLAGLIHYNEIVKEALKRKADTDAIPTKVSQLTNDAKYITIASVPTKLSQLTNDSGFITSAAIPTKVSELTNDAKYITSADVPTKLSQLVNDTKYITSADIPTDVSAFTNDAGYLTKETDPTVPAWAKESTKPTYTKSEVGLSNVDNKSSETIRSEITSKNVTDALGFTPLDSVTKGANNGVAELDSTGKVPASQLPSFVDDVLEFDDKSKFPATGESGKIYIDKAKNITYRWSGSMYVAVGSGLALGETETTAYRGDRGKIAYDHSQTAHAPANAQENVIEKIQVNGIDQTITNKVVDIHTPTKVSELTNDSKFITKDDIPTKVSAFENDSKYVNETTLNTELDKKQDKLTAGTNIVIDDDNTISVDGEFYDGIPYIYMLGSQVSVYPTASKTGTSDNNNKVFCELINFYKKTGGGRVKYPMLTNRPTKDSVNAPYTWILTNLDISLSTNYGIARIYFRQPYKSNYETKTGKYGFAARRLICGGYYYMYFSREEYDNGNVTQIYSNSGLTATSLLDFTANTVYDEIIDSTNLDKVLSTTNTTAYTPTQNYHPATKKYVDDSLKDVVVPTKTSELENDSKFITSSNDSIKDIIYLTYDEYKELESLGKLEPDTEYHIEDAQKTIDDLQKTLDSLQEQITTLKNSLGKTATSNSYNDLDDKPTIPTVNNTLTSTSTTQALSAAQGKVLNDNTTLQDISSCVTLPADGFSAISCDVHKVGKLLIVQVSFTPSAELTASKVIATCTGYIPIYATWQMGRTTASTTWFGAWTSVTSDGFTINIEPIKGGSIPAVSCQANFVILIK